MKKLIFACLVLCLAFCLFGCYNRSKTIKVGTIEEFLNSGADYNDVIQLTNDIDFADYEWTPRGIFYLDGNGYSLKNLSMEVADGDDIGIFTSFRSIKNVTFENVSITYYGKGSNIGGIIGKLNDDNNYDFYYLENVKITGKIYAPSASNVGGVIGYIRDVQPNLKNVEADIEVTGKDCVGGIVGKIGYAEKLDTLFDQIMGNSGTKYSTIGINILESTNHGTITSIGECAGGIVGAFYDKSGSINNCNNYGAINAKTNCGGLAGVAVLSVCNNSLNYGTITSTMPFDDGNSYAGGIAGQMLTFNQNVKLLNFGNVNGLSKSVGGICGYIINSTLFECKNTGIIEGEDFVGGLVGYADGNSQFVLCQNSGDTTANFGSVGGVIGYANNSFVNMSANSGTIYGKTCAGGIVGKYNASDTNSDGVVVGSTNSGDIISSGFAAGIIGRVEASPLTDLDTNTNTGVINGNQNDEIANY